MSVREAEAQETKSSTSAAGESSEGAERRNKAGQRVQFEALVEIGELEGQGGFEAESVDVSPGGMRLRTAYLPNVGDKLICRFEGPGAELLVEGSVLWRNEEARGGEFGLQFNGVDEHVAEALRAMCAPVDEVESAPEQAARGARVRLHIEGLGSPMKARVREAAGEAIHVGSNLEFLKVGRALELEDVEGGSKREAYVDHVAVEVDPQTNVPQLVVSLRYEGKPLAVAARAATAALGSDKPRPSTRPTIAAAGAPEREQHDADELSENAGTKVTKAAHKLGQAGTKAAQATLTAAKKLGPAVAGASAAGRGVLQSILARAKQRRAARGDESQGAQVRRRTAPPPSGALTSDGKRLVREHEEEAGSAGDRLSAAPVPRSRRRAAMVGGSVGLVLVLSLFGLSRAMHGSDATATTAVPASATPLAALPAAAIAPAAEGVVSANVPLFGATPLSTTELVPSMPTAPDGSSAPKTDPLLAAAGAAGEEEGAPGEAMGGEEDGEGSLQKEWGTGSVRRPQVLRLKMDGAVAGIRGTSSPMGFTIAVPGRRALSSSSDLARKDKRLESVDVINTPEGSEITVAFREPIAAYVAKVRGERLEIALGTDKQDKKVASTGPKKKKTHADAQAKSAKVKKKAATKASGVKKKAERK
jgi:hypothetical protein